MSQTATKKVDFSVGYKSEETKSFSYQHMLQYNFGDLEHIGFQRYIFWSCMDFEDCKLNEELTEYSDNIVTHSMECNK